MKLTSGLIYDCLRSLGAEAVLSGDSDYKDVARPVIYRKNADHGSHLCLLPPDFPESELLPMGVYLTVGPRRVSGLSPRSALIAVSGVSQEELWNMLQGIFERFDDWDDAMTRIIERDGSYAEIINLCTDTFNCKLSLVDHEFNYVAYSAALSQSDGFVVDNHMTAEAVSEHLANPEFERVKYETDVFEYFYLERSMLGRNFRRSGLYIGRLVMSPGDELSPASYTWILRHLAQRIEVMIDRNGSFLHNPNRMEKICSLLDGLLAGPVPEPDAVGSALQSVGWQRDDRLVLIRIQPEFRHERVLHSGYYANLIESRWPGTAVIEYESNILILANLNRSDGHDIRSDMADFLRENLMLGAFSRIFSGIEHVFAAWRQTEIAVRLGRELDSTRWVLHFDDYCLIHWIRHGTDGFMPSEICSPALLTLIEHDRGRGTEFYATIKALFNAGFNYSRAADLLFIHRTTLINRANRIMELTGLDIDDSDTRLYLQLSIKYLDSR